MGSFMWIPVVATAATFSLYLLVKNVPSVSEEDRTKLKFPYSLEELRSLADMFAKYQDTHQSYMFLVFCSAYLYKQTFSIPGSFFLNVLAGALLGSWVGVPVVCLLSAVGSSCCYLLAKHCARDYVRKKFPSKLDYLQMKVEENRDSLFFYLLFIRLFPMTPNWLLNILFPIVNVPLHLQFFSILIGLIPYNFISVQTGGILSQISSLDDVFTWSTMAKLLMVALMALVPGILLKKYKAKSKETKLQ